MPLTHLALFYDGDSEYTEALSSFVRQGIDAGERVFVSAPETRHALLREALDGEADSCAIEDMRPVGRNPSRIIPALESFVSAAPGPVRFVGEPTWLGCSAAEIVEGARHEALLNIAFASRDLTILCPYDVDCLPHSVLDDAGRTHPLRLDRDGVSSIPSYDDPLVVWSAADRPLAPPPGPTAELPLDELSEFRRELRAYAFPVLRDIGRMEDLVVAACEAATNAVQHGAGGAARAWRGPAELVCEISSGGTIDDPLVGRRTPPPRARCGRGLWLVNQLCDLVELRSGPGGTVVRLHMTLA
jgi:anti-sigma regulatory factor (Ser/Thr protein kinase)